MTDLTTQLVELAEGRLWTLQALFGPGSTDALDTRMRSTVATWAQILTGDDDHTCAQLVIDLAAWLWPDDADTSHPDDRWWSTPLGQAMARSTGSPLGESVTRSVAAALLGVHPGTVAQLSARGTIAKHPDGGLVTDDVLRYGAERRH